MSRVVYTRKTTRQIPNALTATRIHPYKSDIVTSEDVEWSETTRRNETHDEDFKEFEDGHSDVGCPVPVSVQLPRHELSIIYHQRTLLMLS